MSWVLLLAGAGCTSPDAAGDLDPSTEGAVDGRTGPARFVVQLHDAPTDDVDEVWLSITGVRAHHVDLGWQQVSTTPQTVDLLALQDGRVADLGAPSLAPGTYDQLRLDLDDAWVTVDGVEEPLDVPSGFTSGVKVNLDVTLGDCGDVVVDLDWDVHAQLNLNPQGYKLRPTLKVDTWVDESACVACSGPVVFADPALEAAVDAALGLPLDAADAEQVTVLDISNAGVTDSAGLECFTGLRQLTAANNDIVDLAPLAGLTLMEQLRLQGNQIEDITALADMSDLLILWLQSNGSGVSDSSPLSGATAMQDLRISALGPTLGSVSDLTPLTDMDDLLIFQAYRHDISDLTPLAGKPQLWNLLLNYNQVTDISPLAGNDALEVVWLSFKRGGVTDLSPLAGATRLSDLRISADAYAEIPGGVTDISMLDDKANLRIFAASNQEISDISALAGKPLLSELYLDGNNVTDISALAGNDALTTVWLQWNGSGVTDLSPLSGAVDMRDLRVSCFGQTPGSLTDLTPLAGMNDLWFFEARNHQINDTTPLAGKCSLANVYLTGNPLTCPDPVLDDLETCGVNVSACP